MKMSLPAIIAALSAPMLTAHGQDGAGAAGMREVYPHVRVDVERGLVELEGSVPIVANDPEAPVVYLELIACIPDTKEHEVVVVTGARPSHVHAALLMIGLEPGRPGFYTWEGEELTAHAPEGDPVIVEL
ncbi:MAG: hypothetical protein VYC34_06390, partial [Planctomycetota bacterium]|nr:hypothetical protein [Planctomycetota bacterium]